MDLDQVIFLILDHVIVMLLSMPVLDSASCRKLNGDISPTHIYKV